MYYCPCCGEELNFDNKVYLAYGRTVIGCEACIDTVDAEDALDNVEE